LKLAVSCKIVQAEWFAVKTSFALQGTMSNIYLHTQQGKRFHESKERLSTLFDVLAERETTFMLHFQTPKQIRATQDSQHEDCFAVRKVHSPIGRPG